MTGFDGTSDEFLKDIEQEKLKLIDLVAQGEIALDGVMSPLTKELMQKLGAQGVDMTSWWAMTSRIGIVHHVVGIRVILFA